MTIPAQCLALSLKLLGQLAHEARRIVHPRGHTTHGSGVVLFVKRRRHCSPKMSQIRAAVTFSPRKTDGCTGIKTPVSGRQDTVVMPTAHSNTPTNSASRSSQCEPRSGSRAYFSPRSPMCPPCVRNEVSTADRRPPTSSQVSGASADLCTSIPCATAEGQGTSDHKSGNFHIPPHALIPTVSPLMIPLLYCHINSFQRASSMEKSFPGGENKIDGQASHHVEL